MMIQPEYPNFGPGIIPQANPSDGGRGGIGADALGTQFRDWSRYPILARLTGNTGNKYGFVQIAVGATGATFDVAGGIHGSSTTAPIAYEVNGITTAMSGRVVELWPQYSTFPAWAFVAAAKAQQFVTDVTCVDGELVVTKGP